MTSSLAPALLLSMPQMADPNFARTVVLLCKHNQEGAFGLIMNRPLVTTGRVVVSLDPPVSTERELEVWIGGPVEPGSSWILVGGQLRLLCCQLLQHFAYLHIASGNLGLIKIPCFQSLFECEKVLFIPRALQRPQQRLGLASDHIHFA